MNYSEVKRELKNEFESFLKPLGYKAKTDAQGCEFSKINVNSITRVGYGIANYIDEFYTGCYIKISSIPIQNIEGKIFNEIGIYDTLSTGTSDYFNDLNFRYKIRTQENIKDWVNIIQNIYREYAIPFFEKYNSVDQIDKLLNDNPAEKIKYCDDLSWRIIKGLIAAKLNDNPNYDKLRDYYKSEVESKLQGYFMYEKCMKTINFLDQYTSEELNQLANESK